MTRYIVPAMGLTVLLMFTACSTEMAEVKATEAAVAAPAPTDTAGVVGMSPAEASAVTVERAIHFAGPNNTDVLVPAGSYQAEIGETSQIKLIGKDQAAPLVLMAAAVSHDEKIEMPVARLMAGEEDTQRLLFLTPGGAGWAAVGSESGLTSRGIAGALGSFKVTQTASFIKVLQLPTGGWVNPGGRFIPSDALPMGKRYGYNQPFTVLYACRGKLAPWPKSTFVGSIFFPAGSCFTNNGKISSFEVLTPVWQYASNGTIPNGAYPTAGTAYYSCRAFYDGGKIPGKVGSGLKGCSIGYKGKEIIVPGYEVLMTSFVTSGMSTNVTANPETYARAVYGGSSFYVDRLCAASYQGALHPGRFNLNQNACAIGFNGKEVLITQFNLVEAKMRSFPPDQYTLMGGKNERGRLYPLCRFVHANGEAQIGYLDPDMGTNNDPGPCNFMMGDGNTGREPFNATQGIWDMYKNWSPGWDPVVK